VAGITTTYHAFNQLSQWRLQLQAEIVLAAEGPSAVPVSEMKALEAALGQLIDGPTGFGAAHRDLGRRLNDMLVGDFAPTASVVAGVDGPCRAIDAALERLRQLETPAVAAMRAKQAATAQRPIASWTPPSSACGPK
jgi:hypothetical protein